MIIIKSKLGDSEISDLKYQIVRYLLFIAAVSVYLFFTDAFPDISQKYTNPHKYWCKQIAIYEQKVYETELLIKNWEGILGDKCESINRDELVRTLIIEGKEPEEARNIADRMLRQIAEARKEAHISVDKIRGPILEHSYKKPEEYRKELLKAKNELSKSPRK